MTPEDVQLLVDFMNSVESKPVLEACVVVRGRIYGYNPRTKEYVEAELVPMPDSYVPEEIEKRIVMKRFNLKEV